MHAESSVPANWWLRNVSGLKSGLRVILGVIWLIDGLFKFTSGYVGDFLGDVQNSQANAPSWLSGWYSFWAGQAAGHGTLIVYSVGTLEMLLGLALIFGFVRKLAYIGGIALSLLIWAVPEGFGGPYGAGTGATDVGTGIIYAIAILGLVIINAISGPSRWSLDAMIERRFPGWARLAEFGSRPAH